MASNLEAVTARLNRGTRSPNARYTALGEVPFGKDLTVRSVSLGNGLEVHLLRDDSAPLVSYQSWFRVGSRHEKKGKTGLAHFFEHLMFKETKNRGPGEFDRLIETAGGETNAATWTDWTHYYENVPKGELPLVVGLEADRMENLILRKGAVDSEREVVMNERRYRVDDDVSGKASETLYAKAFRKHPYGWPTIGWMSDIEGYTVADCRAFYGTYYAPNNACLVVAGDFRERDALELIRDHYGSMKRSRVPAEKVIAEPVQRRERRTTLRQPTDTEKLEVGWRGPAWTNPDYPVLTVLNEVLTGGRSSRLYRVLVAEKELASSVYAGSSPFEHPGLFELSADARPGVDAAKLLTIVDTVIRKVQKRGISASELEKAKNRLELGFLSVMETIAGKAEQLGFVATISGDVSAIDRRLEAFRSVTREDAQRVAQRYLGPSTRSVVIVVPGREAS